MNQAQNINIEKQVIINNPTGPIVTTGNLTKEPVFAQIPARPNRFVGREAIMAEMVRRLTQDDAPIAISTQGMGGVGKTTLATMLAYHDTIRAHFSDGILWAGLGPQGSAMVQLAQWGDALGLDVRAMVDEASRHQAVKGRLGQGKYLLIIDDVWDEASAQWLKCGGPNCRHVLTTRDETLARKFALVANSLALRELSPDEALELLTALAPEAVASNREVARQLLQRVGYLPLAVELLGGLLQEAVFEDERAAAMQTLRDPQARLRLAQARLGSHTLGQVVPLAEVVRLSVQDLPAACQEAWRALGVFAPKPATFSRAAALEITQADSPHLSRLITRNVVERLSDTALALHPVIADVAGADLTHHPQRATWQTRHAAYYVAEANKDRHDWRYIATIYPQLQQAWEVAPNEMKLELIWATKTYQHAQGLWSDLQPWYEAALTFAEGEDKGTLLNNLSQIFKARGDYETALSYLQQSLTIRREIGDKAGEGTTLNNLSTIAHARGDYETALSYLQQSLTIRREIGDKAGEGITLNNLCTIAYARGDYETALSYLQQSLTICREIGDKAGEGATLNNLSQIFQARGDYETALSYLQQSLTIQREIGDKAGWCATMFNLGHIYWTKGEQAEAIGAWVAVYRVTNEIQLAKGLQALAGLAGQLGLPGGLRAWEALAGTTANGE